MGGKTSGSGNARWKAAMLVNQIAPGRGNRRKCIATSHITGKTCGNLAVRGETTCRLHGGLGMKAIRKIREERDAKIEKTIERARRKVQREFQRISQG